MKLAKGFITQNYRDEQLMVATGAAARSFHGLVRSNETAAFIIDRLKSETDEEAIVAALTAEYDVEPDKARADVARVIEQLCAIGAIEA